MSQLTGKQLLRALGILSAVVTLIVFWLEIT